jgi:hypothetical protein
MGPFKEIGVYSLIMIGTTEPPIPTQAPCKIRPINKVGKEGTRTKIKEQTLRKLLK